MIDVQSITTSCRVIGFAADEAEKRINNGDETGLRGRLMQIETQIALIRSQIDRAADD